MITLSLAGLANRNEPSLWLNATAPSWNGNVKSVMWPYPQADAEWLSFLRSKGVNFTVAADSSPCTLLADDRLSRAVKGIVRFDDTSPLDAPRWLAASAAGLYDGLPATNASLARWPCLAALPIVADIPGDFGDDLAAYAWATEHLLPHASTSLLVGACHPWTEDIVAGRVSRRRSTMGANGGPTIPAAGAIRSARPRSTLQSRAARW